MYYKADDISEIYGLIIIQIHFDSRESDLSSNGYYILAQELIYQWLGSWITPSWWSDAHINKAIVGFLAASTSLEVSTIKYEPSVMDLLKLKLPD